MATWLATFCSCVCACLLPLQGHHRHTTKSLADPHSHAAPVAWLCGVVQLSHLVLVGPHGCAAHLGWLCRAVSSRRLVPGDVLVLLRGKATCDMVLLTGNCLVEESMLSGEVLSLLPLWVLHYCHAVRQV